MKMNCYFLYLIYRYTIHEISKSASELVSNIFCIMNESLKNLKIHRHDDTVRRLDNVVSYNDFDNLASYVYVLSTVTA